MANTRDMWRVRLVKHVTHPRRAAIQERVPFCWTGNKDDAWTLFRILQTAHFDGKPTYLEISKWGQDGFTPAKRSER